MRHLSAPAGGSAVANSIAVGEASSPTVLWPNAAMCDGEHDLAATGIEHVALDLALINQRRNLRLRLAQTPRRSATENSAASPRFLQWKSKSNF